MGEFEAWLGRPQNWVGGFDLPFGLPRELLVALGWPLQWQASIEHFCQLTRENVRAQLKACCDAGPVGAKLAHRACDGPAGSSPSMNWVNPPVAFMLHAGVPLLLKARVHFPGLQPAPTVDAMPTKVALEAYPGLLARELIGTRSYKSDEKAKQTPERLIARKDLITALELGQTRLGLRIKLSHAQRDALIEDASGDTLDAVLCLVQAAWAQRLYAAGDALYGLPPNLDTLEGWIVSA
ncbi:hypothetical protein NIES3787_40940 [Microcystis aeruginosa NIES-3787]|uniref:DUF429 domain-containing protein n=1 Tax=Microcystis aeruginosa NIES-3787 TaxID=2517782 RepID=A0A6H9GMQ4_MICAE|nr:hypothetical protein NIES3787_40940 [Microcystis aeruginosa NIES-3787]